MRDVTSKSVVERGWRRHPMLASNLSTPVYLCSLLTHTHTINMHIHICKNACWWVLNVQGLVLLTCNHSYSRGWNSKITSSRPAWDFSDFPFKKQYFRKALQRLGIWPTAEVHDPRYSPQSWGKFSAILSEIKECDSVLILKEPSHTSPSSQILF